MDQDGEDGADAGKRIADVVESAGAKGLRPSPFRR
jgi:hypothetical protein